MICSQYIYDTLYAGIRSMQVSLPKDVQAALRRHSKRAEGLGSTVLKAVEENIRLAGESCVPLCQDTGMILCFVEYGEHAEISGDSLRDVLARAVKDAFCDGYFRKSVVADPLNVRNNTGTNLPPLIHWEVVPGSSVRISLLAKGFGSENCSCTEMLKPTAGRRGVITAVERIMERAGGAPCPPVVLGIGIGGTMDYAALLSKKALLRELDDIHPSSYYASLETDIMEAVNRLGIGPGGLGGGDTCLGVKIESSPTHIAGLPLAVSVNCWADRKFSYCFRPAAAEASV